VEAREIEKLKVVCKDTMGQLLEGHARFRREVFPRRKEHFRLLAEIQQPDVLFVTCSDSRIVPDMIFQTEPGDLFICRNAGNVVPPYGISGAGLTNEGVSATIEYAVKVLGVGHIIVCGHSDCGAARAVFEQRDVSQLPVVSRWLKYVDAARPRMRKAAESADELARLKEFICANVRQQLQNLCTHPEVRDGVKAGTLQVHGWFYEIRTGEIEVVDAETGDRQPLVAGVE
jgi:carbonic anhydrase